MSWVKNLWRPPTSKEIGLTKEDTFFTDKVLEYVHKYYYDNIQIRETADDPEYLGERKLWLSQNESREVDTKYNDKMHHYKYTHLVVVGLMVGIYHKSRHLHTYLEMKILQYGTMVQEKQV